MFFKLAHAEAQDVPYSKDGEPVTVEPALKEVNPQSPPESLEAPEEPEEVAVPEEDKPREIKVETPANDFRFPIVNQSRRCFVAYNEAHKCFKAKSEEDDDCVKLAQVYRSICPAEWLESWAEARENGTWFGKY